MNTELERRLRADMERATQDVRIPPGLARKAFRHHRQRIMTARMVTAAGAVTVLAAAGLAAAGASGAFGPGGSRAGGGAYLVARVERALSAPSLNNLVGFARTVYPVGIPVQPVPGGLASSGGPGGSPPQSVGYELTWAYHHASKVSAFTASGRHLFDERFTRGHGPAATTAVIYTSHTWWTTTDTGGPAGNGPASGCLPNGDIRLPGSGAGFGWPGFIRSQLACGAYTVTSKHAVIDNVSAIEITGNSGHLTLWVNRATYLPVRLDDGPVQIHFRWLRPTPANQALLNTPVPAGFHQVPPPS
jgi:hypothetical protein